MSQFSVPCVVYRGGTSRGLFFNAKDLPEDMAQWKKIFLDGVDAHNLSQVNGLGSGTSHTSKVVVIGPPTAEGAYIDYTFYQIGIGEMVVDSTGTCGNLMAAVGAYAVDEGLVVPKENKETFTIYAYNTNIGKIIRLTVPMIDGKAKVSGTYQMAGLQLPGAKYEVDILSPGGGKLGSTLPLESTFELKVKEKSISVSVVDIVNPFVFLSVESLGITGADLFSDLSNDIALLSQLETIRCEMSVRMGLTGSMEEAANAPAIPKIAIVSAPIDYVTTSGISIKREEVDFVAKMVSMGRFHRTFAGSGLYNLAAAALLPGTIPNNCTHMTVIGREGIVKIGHPDGIAEVRVRLIADNNDIEYVGLDRTARRVMKGELFIPNE